MRVLHLNTHASGGSYEYAALLCTALTEQGIESRVLCKDSPPAQTGRVLLDRVIRRSYVSLSTEPWHGTRRLMPAPAAEELADVDVVHLHTVADWFDVPDWLETLPRRMGVVISIHDMWHITGGCFLYRGCDRYTSEIGPCDSCPILRWPANRLLAKGAYSRKLHTYEKRGACLVANSQWMAEIVARSPIAKACGEVSVILPAIDTTVFQPQDKDLCRKHLNLPADAFVIVTGGASLNDTNKNVPWLLQQLSRLPALDRVIVVAFGNGAVPVPDGLNVRFTGPMCDRRDLARVFASADVFVSASLMETYGLTLVEAMACGTPIVAFRVGGIPEAAPDSQGAILCEPQDGAALLEAIVKLQNSLSLREELGKAGANLTAIRNSTARFAVEFARFYQECVDHRKAPAAGQPALVA
jgi:glycosyltransferase involved in cell wall biosynthesis